MKRKLTLLSSVAFTTLILISCGSGPTNDSTTAETDAASMQAEDTKPVEQKLDVQLQTQLVEWGGDGKWHDMYQNDDGSYWVNYADPFKLILSGNYTNLTVKVKSSGGAAIFNESGISLAKSGSYVVSNDKMMGEYETAYTVEISEDGKKLFTAKIESMPGGE